MLDSGVEAFVDGLVPKLFAPAHLESMKEKAAYIKEIGYGTSLQGAVGTARGMKERSDRTKVIENSRLPVLLVSGACDQIVPKESTFAAVNDRAVKVELEHAGHMGMIEEPKPLAEAILSFVKHTRS
ncbi:Alpha/beta hydrolase family protein [compost metagenome]